MKRLTTLGCAASLCVLVVLSGCGDSSASDDAFDAVSAYQEAFIEKDGEAVCAALTGRARRAVVADLKTLVPESDCGAMMGLPFGAIGADDFRRLREAHDRLSPADVSISDSTATVALSEDEELKLVRIDGDWYIDGSSFEEIEPLPSETVIDTEEVERILQTNLERSLDDTFSTVECPENQPFEIGAKFTCRVESTSGTRSTATLKILNAEADISVIGFRPETR